MLVGKYLYGVFRVAGTKCISTFSIASRKVISGIQQTSLKEAPGLVASDVVFDLFGIPVIRNQRGSNGELRRSSTRIFIVGKAFRKCHSLGAHSVSVEQLFFI